MPRSTLTTGTEQEVMRWQLGVLAAGGKAPESDKRSALLYGRQTDTADVDIPRRRSNAMATRGLPGEFSPAHSSILGGLGGSAPRLTLSKLPPLKLR
jgi:hypothetical protein